MLDYTHHYSIATVWPADGNEGYCVKKISVPTVGPELHDLIEGPFPTRDEAQAALAQIQAGS